MARAHKACLRSPSGGDASRGLAAVKSEVGVTDAWVRDGMIKAEADALITEIVAGAEALLRALRSDAMPQTIAGFAGAVRALPSGCSRTGKYREG